MVAHFVSVLLTAFVAYTAKPGSSLFSWHPTMMTFAYSFFMIEAILLFSPHSSILAKYSRKTKSTTHWIMMLLALACMIGGYLAIVINKDINGKLHLTSWHGLIGFITIMYTCVQAFGGLFQIWGWLRDLLPRSFTLGRLKGYHATSGLTLYMLACISLFLGMQSNWFVANVTGTSWYACAACPMVLLLIVSNQVTSAYLPKSSRK